MTRATPTRRALLPAVSLAATLVLATGAAASLAELNRVRDEARFQREVDETVVELRSSLDTYVALLRGGAGLCAGIGIPDRDVFFRYAERLGIARNYPGVQGIGLSLVVPRGDREAFRNWWALRGLSGLEVWPPGQRETLTAIVHLYPLDRLNAAAIGYDMFSEPIRREAMERARDRGGPAASARVTLVQEIDIEKQAGFLVYVPFYTSIEVPPTPEERAEELVGFVYGPFRASDLLGGVLDAKAPLVEVAVYDGTEIEPQVLLHRSASWRASDQDGHTSRFNTRRTVEIYGRPWTLDFRSSLAFDQGHSQVLVWLVLMGGLAVGGVLFFATLSQARARAGAEAIAAELRRSEAASRAAQEQAETANRLKDEFLATVSHELRTPLSAMLGWTQLLRAGRVDAAEQPQVLEVIERNARAQARLVEDLLDVSRILSGKLRLETGRVELAQVVEAALESLRPAAEARNIALETRLSTQVGPVVGDPSRLQQVAWNLLSNAIKFTPAGGRVMVNLRRIQGEVELSVKDTGVGIQPAFLPHVFERFRQADASSTRHHGGLGLGLGIVRHLVELHGGTVHAESEGQGKGATFTVRLPIRQLPREHTLEEPLDDEASSEALIAISLDGLKVLVVDDEADARTLFRRSLEEAGARVVVAGSAAEAMEVFQREHPDVIVSDIGMPGENGWSLIERIRRLPAEQGGKTPALALTAFARVEDRQRSEQAGFQLHLAKPVPPVKLTRAVAELAGR